MLIILLLFWINVLKFDLCANNCMFIGQLLCDGRNLFQITYISVLTEKREWVYVYIQCHDCGRNWILIIIDGSPLLRPLPRASSRRMHDVCGYGVNMQQRNLCASRVSINREKILTSLQSTNRRSSTHWAAAMADLSKVSLFIVFMHTHNLLHAWSCPSHHRHIAARASGYLLRV